MFNSTNNILLRIDQIHTFPLLFFEMILQKITDFKQKEIPSIFNSFFSICNTLCAQYIYHIFQTIVISYFSFRF